MIYKAIYVMLGIISALFLALCFMWHLTSEVSTFEGGRSISRLFGTPILFLGILILWFIDYKIFHKTTIKFIKSRNIAFSVITVVSFFWFINYANNEINERKAKIQNNYHCVEQVKESYEGVITDTKYQRLTIIKTDSTKFKYTRLFMDNFDSYFHVGQKISKKANETEFEIELKDGSLKKFKIPCYQ